MTQLVFIAVFGLVCLVSILVTPMAGVLGYVTHYSTGFERYWWTPPMRYSLILAIVAAVGIGLHYGTLRFGKKVLLRQETLILAFLALIWLSYLISPSTEGRYGSVDHPSMKMTKVVIFTLMLTHAVTTRRRLEALIWVIVVTTLLLGWQAWEPSRRYLRAGRLERLGGTDFREANVLPAYLAGMLALIGAQFLKTRWPGKIVCLIAGVLASNAIVLTRSRGAVVGLALGGVAAVAIAPRRIRGVVILCVIVAGIGMYALTDPQFISRASTIQVDGERDSASESRIAIWKGAVAMLLEHPLGVGVGNFHQSIGSYAPQHTGMDAHNTFVRCFGELGLPGIALFLLLIGNASRSLWMLLRRPPSLPGRAQGEITYTAYGLLLSLIIVLGCGLTVTLLYVEALWWILALPTCMLRVIENLQTDAAGASAAAKDVGPAEPKTSEPFGKNSRRPAYQQK